MFLRGMANVLSKEKKQQVEALGRLGWPLRRIQDATGVRRETASKYLKAAGIPVRPTGGWGHRPAKAAKEVSTDSVAKAANEVSTDLAGESGPSYPPRPGRSPSSSACEPYRELIELGLGRGRNAMAIWQDLVTEHEFGAQYASVKRFVAKLRGARSPTAHPIIVTEPGEECQVDYGQGPMVRYPETGKYRRTRLFVMTLGYSRKSVRLLTFKSSTQIWAELHEKSISPARRRNAHCRARQPARRRAQSRHLRARAQPTVCRYARALRRGPAAVSSPSSKP